MRNPSSSHLVVLSQFAVSSVAINSGDKTYFVLRSILQVFSYRKSPKFSDRQNIAVITLPTILTNWAYSREMPPKDTDGIANSEDPDQTAPLGAV